MVLQAKMIQAAATAEITQALPSQYGFHDARVADAHYVNTDPPASPQDTDYANVIISMLSQDVYYAIVGYNGGEDLITLGLSHELAESFSDPAGTGIQLSLATKAPNWTEISDACENQTNVVDDVDVQKYWSEHAKACVLPTKPDNRVPAGSKRTLPAAATFKITGGQRTRYVSTGNFSYQENAAVDNYKTSSYLFIGGPSNWT